MDLQNPGAGERFWLNWGTIEGLLNIVNTNFVIDIFNTMCIQEANVVRDDLTNDMAKSLYIAQQLRSFDTIINLFYSVARAFADCAQFIAHINNTCFGAPAPRC